MIDIRGLNNLIVPDADSKIDGSCIHAVKLQHMLCYVVKSTIDDEAIQQHGIRLEDKQWLLLGALGSALGSEETDEVLVAARLYELLVNLTLPSRTLRSHSTLMLCLIHWIVSSNRRDLLEAEEIQIHTILSLA